MTLDSSTICVRVPTHDCDIVLSFSCGKELLIQCRPSNADINYEGSLDIILPNDQPVACYKGDDLQVSSEFHAPHIRVAKQLVLELPKHTELDLPADDPEVLSKAQECLDQRLVLTKHRIVDQMIEECGCDPPP